MLSVLRKLSETWLFKGILALVVLSFASLFGVGSFSNLKRGDAVVVENDGNKLTNEELFVDFNNEIKKMEKVSGQSITYKDAVDNRLYISLLIAKGSEFTFNSFFDELNVDISPATLGSIIRSQPIFLDQSGNFSKSMYEYYLSTNASSEYEFENKMADFVKEGFISSPLKDTVSAPNTLVDAVYKFQNEKRDGRYFEIDASNMVVTATPSDDDLKGYYEGYEENFMAPEYRKATVMFIPYKKIKEKIVVTDDEIQNRFDELKLSYTVPEKRQVEQILVQDEETANKIVEELKHNNDFIKVASDMANQSKEDTDFGLVTVDSLITEIADSVFSADKGEVVGPIQTYLGYHVLKVVDVIEGKDPELKDKKQEIVKVIKEEKLFDVAYDLIVKIDDGFGMGESLENIAKNTNAEIITTGKIDIVGYDENNKKVEADYMSKEFLENLYSSSMDVNQVSVTIENKDGIVVFRIDDITPPTLKEFANVKDELFASWKKDQKIAMLEDKKDAILKDIEEGMPFKNIVGKNKVSKLTNVTRADSSYAVDALFSIAGENQTGYNKTDTGYVFVGLDRITPVNEKDMDTSLVKKQLDEEISESLYAEFLSVIANKYNLKIDQNSAKEALESYMVN